MRECVLRALGADFNVDAFLADSDLEPCQVWHKGEPRRDKVHEDSGFNLVVYEASTDGLEEQVNGTVAFLRAKREELKRLMGYQGIEDAVLDFAISKRETTFAQFDHFPAELVRLAGELGMGIELSQYAVSGDEQEEHDINLDAQINDFGMLAQEYCDWAESTPGTEREEHFKALLMLSSLYNAALLLPDVEPSDAFGAKEPPSSDYKEIHKRFGSLPFQYYQDVFNPLSSEDETPDTGDVCDDLADIYGDLKKGLWFFQQSYHTDAAYYWKLHFGIHWGKHATDALKALHCYEYED